MARAPFRAPTLQRVSSGQSRDHHHHHHQVKRDVATDSAARMLRAVYLFFVLVRLYFALSPSYIHPDEHFQGPEIISGIDPCHPRNLPQV